MNIFIFTFRPFLDDNSNIKVITKVALPKPQIINFHIFTADAHLRPILDDNSMRKNHMIIKVAFPSPSISLEP